MRGNRYSGADGDSCKRSIPAHAGQPISREPSLMTIRVYPRACGATLTKPIGNPVSHGLSPRMRGNRSAPPDYPNKDRSIPAHAGQPGYDRVVGLHKGVYPRACGATPRIHAYKPTGGGLSPRMRGNPYPTALAIASARSIPAHAGQPLCDSESVQAVRVYPRACGATALRCSYVLQAMGLSPRMRGNQRNYIKAMLDTRSIPAHAGQPRPFRYAPALRPVYPRACGATLTAVAILPISRGLSPRMRGNRIRAATRASTLRSIPAHGGATL